MRMKAEMKPLSLDALTLSVGKHSSIEEGVCVMEAVAYVAGEPFSDHPQCACPALTNFLVGWNDGLPDNASRDRLLKPLVPRIVGTRGSKALEMRRRWMAFDWLVRENAAMWMDLTPALKPHADALRGLPEINAETIELCEPVLFAARDARDVAWAAASAAARDVASAAAWDAARDVARDVAWAAASAAAWAAASAAARDAARDVASAAAWAAAWDVAWAAARDVAWAAASAAARDVAWAAASAAASAAAWAALKPTVEKLQVSALELVERMINAQETTEEPCR